MGTCLSSPTKDDKEDTAQKPAARPSGGGLNRTSVAAPVSRKEDLDAAENPSLKAEAGSVAAASDLPSTVSSPAEPPAPPSSSSNGTAAPPADAGLQTGAGTSTFAAARQAKLANEQLPGGDPSGGRNTSAPMPVPGGGAARSARSGDGDAEAPGDSSMRKSSGSKPAGSLPLLSRISLTGLGGTSPSGTGGVSDYLRRHSSEGIRKVREANDVLAKKAHGKDESSQHAVATIDPALYY